MDGYEITFSVICFFHDIAITSTSKNYNLDLVQKVLVILYWYRKITEPTDMSIRLHLLEFFCLKIPLHYCGLCGTNLSAIFQTF